MRQLLTGFADVYVGKDMSSDFNSCVKQETPIVADLKEVISDLKTKSLDGWKAAFQTLQKTVGDIKNATAGCNAEEEDMEAFNSDMTALAYELANAQNEYTQWGKNVIESPKELTDAVVAAVNAGESNDFTTVGKSIATILQIAFKPSTEVQIFVSEEDVLTFGPADAQKLLIGIGMGLEQKDFTADMMKCAAGEAPLMTDISAIILDLQEKSIQGLEDAAAAIAKAYNDYSAFMQTCTGYSSDMTKFQTDLQTVATNLSNFSAHKLAIMKNLIENVGAVATDLENLKVGASASDFGKVGQALGDFTRLVFLNVDVSQASWAEGEFITFE